MVRAVESVCVFCGSSTGRDPVYTANAEGLGRRLAEEGTTLVYGGASVGTMGAIARAALDAGGRVVGVIPANLDRVELAAEGLTELHRVGSMHERKALMAELADGFVALPGGLGTLEETAEIATWSQLGLHTKPLGLLNTAGFYDGLLGFLDHATAEGFVRPEHRSLLLAADDPAALLGRMRAWSPATAPKWVDRR